MVAAGECGFERKLLDQRFYPSSIQRYLSGCLGTNALRANLAKSAHVVPHPNKRELAATHIVDGVEVRRRSQNEVKRAILEVHRPGVALFHNGGRANRSQSGLGTVRNNGFHSREEAIKGFNRGT